MDYLHASNAFGSPSPPPGFAAPNLLFDQSQGSFHHELKHGEQDHPDFWHLAGLVSEAVLEVVCVSCLGYIAAKRGLFSAKVQKDVANLNIYFFTPCLIFSKLAAQLTGEKLTELWIIPIILFVQTVISWLSAEVGTRLLKIKKQPQRNFVKAMAVFGNSNSLPLSLVISLSHTISGLHWDRVPGDNDDEVGARGILYLLVFSQLGQAVRWSWGMNTLLRPMDEYTPEERGEYLTGEDEERFDPFKDSSSTSSSRPTSSGSTTSSSWRKDTPSLRAGFDAAAKAQIKTDEFASASGRDDAPPSNGDVQQRGAIETTRDNAITHRQDALVATRNAADQFKGWRARTWSKVKAAFHKFLSAFYRAVYTGSRNVFSSLPEPLQKVLTKCWYFTYLVCAKIISCLNVPLVAIILSVVVGSIPGLKAFFYTPGTFVNNTVTSAINQLGGVAVPLILFVLGGNLCKSTLPDENPDDRQYQREKRKMLWCSLICRMLIPLLLMAPFLALIAKYTPISILDDPIFIIVCFLLTGAPSALQLAQICQVNDVFVPVISQLLVQSYVVWIFPSTLILVMLALEVVKWAQ